jgi:chemotaxis protein methyltransferase CheR
MSQRISDTTLAMLSDFLAREMGLLFPPERWRDLERGMVSATAQFGFQETQQCIDWLLSAPLTRAQVETLAGFLTIGETYFFREPHIFDILEKEILPGLLQSRRGRDQRLRIWSAGCSTGEEAYSIAILLHRLLPDIEAWNISILATDINPAALQKGIDAGYGKWSFRGTSTSLQACYFTRKEGELFRVVERVRRLVCFEYLNLAADSYPSLHTKTNAMDIVFCRNVLMYFTPEMAKEVVGKLHRSLVDNGWLIVGPVDYSKELFAPFQPVSFAEATCYRKASPVPEELSEAAPVALSSPAAVSSEPGTGSPGESRESRERLPSADFSAVAAPSAPQGGQQSCREAAELYRQGLYAQAAALLSDLDCREEVPAEAMSLLVRSQANRGNLSQALALCDRALGRDKLDAPLHLLRAEVLQEMGLVEEAQLSLKRALYLDPKLVLAHFALGNLTLWQGKGDQALRHFENALALLRTFPPDATVPGSEGMTAGRLSEIIAPIAARLGRHNTKKRSGESRFPFSVP